MGTMPTRAAPLDACFDVLNLQDAKTVQGIHREYVAAGADLIETNTFGANCLSSPSTASRAASARSTGRRAPGARRPRDHGTGRWCWAPSVRSSTSCRSGPGGRGAAAFREQAEALLEGGVDGFVAETFSTSGSSGSR